MKKPVESLQGSLYRAAKADRMRRFHSLHDKICRMDVLWESWRRVKQNKGVAGVDGQSIYDIESSDVEPFLTELQKELQSETYTVQCVRRVFIPKRNGKMRPLGIPTVRDRVVQQAVRLVIEPIFESDFQPFSYGYRPNRSAKQASLEIRKWLNFGLTNVIDIDIDAFFDNIDHDRLLSFVMERVADPYIIKLVREWLHAGVVYLDSVVSYPEEGTPQGGVISPLLANIYLNRLDTWWTELRMDAIRPYNAQMVRYADDVVIFTDSEETHQVMDVFEGLLSELGLSLSAEKSRIASAEDGFDFLSFRFVRRYHPSSGKVLTHFFPSRGALMRFKEKVRFMTAKRFCDDKDEKQLAKELNLFMTGWSNYYNHSNAGKAYTRLQEFVEWKFRQFIRFRHKLTRLSKSHEGYRQPRSSGLMRLSGRISRSWVKSNAAGRSTSDSRVRENLQHG